MTSERSTGATSPEYVEFFIDGEPVRGKPGANLLQAMIEAGENISYFCYHADLSIAAKCRQCLVGIGDAHKLVPACQLNVKEGLQVRSKTEQIRDARRALLEFTLVNHPVDCVICDKAGECALQRQYMDWDGEASLVNHEKVHKPKKVELGPTVVLDAERCILCDRCVRFCREVARSPQLLFAKRGDHTEVSCAPGEQLDNPYSLNVVDICPVGALTDREFRFKSRVWDLWSTRSVCQGCATGCDMEIHHKGGEVFRLVPPKQWDMNENWMCDYGRRSHKELSAAERLSTSLVKGKPTSDRDVAVSMLADGLRAQLAKPAGIAFVLGADLTNEDLYTASTLGKAIGATLYLGDWPDDNNGDTILRSSDPNPNRAGARAIVGDALKPLAELAPALKDIKLLYVVGKAELPGPTLAKLKSVEFVAVQSPSASPLTNAAHIVLPAASWAEVDGTVITASGAIKRLRPAFEPPGQARPNWAWTSQLAQTLQRSRSFANAEEVFAALKEDASAFADAAWGQHLPTKRLRFGGRRG